MAEREPKRTLIYKVVMAVSERDAPPGQCVDIGYLLSFDKDFVKILRSPTASLEGRYSSENRTEEVSYGRSSVRVVSLEHEIMRKNATREGKGKVVPLRRLKQTPTFQVPLEDAAPRSAHSTENP
ncbi:hypothetical protein K2P56_01640 [Patescibacteria group bacterium]|nr:hypothetical protein [Patescibacteria group bacterium]